MLTLHGARYWIQQEKIIQNIYSKYFQNIERVTSAKWWSRILGLRSPCRNPTATIHRKYTILNVPTLRSEAKTSLGPLAFRTKKNGNQILRPRMFHFIALSLGQHSTKHREFSGPTVSTIGKVSWKQILSFPIIQTFFTEGSFLFCPTGNTGSTSRGGPLGVSWKERAFRGSFKNEQTNP